MSSTARTPAIPHWTTALLGLSALAMIVVSTLVDRALSAPTWWVCVAVVSLSWSYVRRRTQAVAETSAKNLDERELATRNIAAWWGQAVMLVLGAAAALILTIASRLDHLSAELALQKSGGIVLSFVIFGAAVPTLVVASLPNATEAFNDSDDLDDFDDLVAASDKAASENAANENAANENAATRTRQTRTRPRSPASTSPDEQHSRTPTPSTLQRPTTGEAG